MRGIGIGRERKDRTGDVNGVLRRAMAVMSIGLILALCGKFVPVWEDGTAGNVETEMVGQPWKHTLGGWMAELFSSLYPGGTRERFLDHEEAAWGGPADVLSDWLTFQSPLASFLKKDQEKLPGVDGQDPSYEEYKMGQAVREEYRYFLMYGDENSGAEQPDLSLAEEQETQPLFSGTPAHDSRQDLPVIGTQYQMEQLKDYDFLMKHFYSVHSSTTARREEMDAEKLLGMDLSLQADSEGPQILVYHSHSQETFADYSEANQEATIVGVGAYLAELLREKGYQVLHDTSQYDMMGGKLDRNQAYNYALDGISGILQKNPSIQVVLDIHRDGVDPGLHMVAEVNGKPTAPIMFFNGMSQTPEGPIEYLQNPNKEENLAFSLQMQVNAAAYFPGLTRKIYLKGLRYNLHLRPRSALVEVGAQTNTYQEARNSMEPLAELVDMVLRGD